MVISSADFLISNTTFKKCPEDEKPEFAFIGRSNVGKSSLINMLTGKKKLAKTSSTPGKTQLINHFVINENWYLVDLPGYGYAKASKKSRNNWEQFISEYLLHRKNLLTTFVLIDARLEPQKIDLEFMNWCGGKGIPFSIIFTKSDKLSSSALQKNLSFYRKELLKYWEELPPVFISSSQSKLGRESVLNYLNEILDAFSQSRS
ncbi:ribosome biogenesis GTP-binding protein YihA/YsxC [Crocinitomicaceae bacterium]|jgi:GTP-binding protein|nr:ribosome biogenesis GTP-binding protein YihA/YsxC [Crocinitomicaceae bacterium]